jgi:hypothetical protein
MALATIHDHLKKSGKYHYLKALPPSGSLRWVDYDSALPPKALVIGEQNNRKIKAFMKNGRSNFWELNFAIPDRWGDQPLPFNDLIELEQHIYPPFNDLVGPSNSDKANLYHVIKYLFVEKFNLEGVGGGGLSLARKFTTGLSVIWRKKVEATKHGDKEKGQKRRELVIEEHDTVVETNANLGFREPLRSAKDDLNSSYNKLRRLLDKSGELYLLKNIPPVEAMTFEKQNLIPKALPKKLLVGRVYRSAENIYAYLVWENNSWGVQYRTASGVHEREFALGEVYNRHSFHPFDKSGAGLVIWYFIAAALTGNIPDDVQNYLREFRHALHKVDRFVTTKRINGSNERGEPTENDERNESAELDESHIQSTLDARPSSSTPNSPNLQQDTPASRDPTNESPQSRKRTAEDAKLDNLELTIAKDRKLTQERNDLDSRIDVKEMELEALKKQRIRLDEAKRAVRRELKRQGSLLTRMPDEE